MNLTAFFFRNKFLLLVGIFIIISGAISYYINTSRNEDPGFKIRTIVITSFYKGASAEVVDKYISEKIEEQLEQVNEIEHIRVKSYDNKSVIYADIYEYYDNLQPIFDKIRRKVQDIQNELPENVFSIIDDEYADVFGTLLSLSAKDFSYEELKEYADKIQQEFLSLKESSKVEILGEQKECVYLYYKNTTQAQYDISLKDVKEALEGMNSIKPSGRIEIKDDYILIQSQNQTSNIKAIENIIINTGGLSNLRFKDIFEIKKEYIKPQSPMCRTNGEKCLIVAISMKESENILNFGKKIKEKIKELNNSFPIGIELKIVSFQADYVKYLTDKFTSSLVQSIAVVMALILLILGVKVGLITGLLIPITILTSFFIMGFFKIGLDKISLSALIISLGILVDNSIVISEGILRKFSNSNLNSKEEGAISVCKTFQTPLLISTLITSCAFLPIYLAQSAVSEYTSSLFKVVIITLLSSWLLSITLLPYLMTKFIRKKNNEQKNFEITKYFSKFIRFSLKQPDKVILYFIIFTLISFILFNFVPKIFFPDSDRATFEIELNLSENSSIQATKKATTEIENYLKTQKEVKNYTSFIGHGAPRYVLSASPDAPKPNYGMILVNTKNYKNLDKIIKKVEYFCKENILNSNTIIRKVPLGPPYDAPVEIRISGYETDEIFKIVRKVQEELRKIKGVTLVKDDWGEKTAFFKIKTDDNSAAFNLINKNEIANTLNSSIDGEEVSYYIENSNSIPIIYKLQNSTIEKYSDITSIDIFSKKYNKPIPLSQIAKLELDFRYPKIFRYDSFLTVTIQGYINNKTSADKVIKKITPYLKSIDYPLGYKYAIGGSVENSKKGNKSISDKIPIAFSIIAILLIGYFNSIKLPAIILTGAIGALSGANIGLLITFSDFGFMTFLGYICLIGIATNNGVILIDTIEKEMKKESNLSEKLKIQKGIRKRVKPVFLTISTTIAGMLPLWIGQDPMFESLAVAIIFGLMSSIFITLIVLPAIYLKALSLKAFQKVD